jgi:hypothetical protein
MNLVSAQELTNHSIIALVRAGVADDAVTYLIRNQPGQYAVTPTELMTLKSAGVSETVMMSITAKALGHNPAIASSPLTLAPPSQDGAPMQDATTPPVSTNSLVSTQLQAPPQPQSNYYSNHPAKRGRPRRTGVVHTSASIGAVVGFGVGTAVGATAGLGIKAGRMAVKAVTPTAASVGTRRPIVSGYLKAKPPLLHGEQE